MIFLESQKENYKKEQYDTANKYQESLSNLEKKSKYDLFKMEFKYKELMQNIEKNYTLKFDEVNKIKEFELSSLQKVVKDLENQLSLKNKTIKQQIEKEGDVNTYLSRIKELENTINEIAEDNKSLKSLFSEKQLELTSLIEQNDYLKKKCQEIERKVTEYESKKSFNLIEFEKEKAKLTFEIDKLHSIIADLEENNNEIKAKNKSLLRNNEKSQSKLPKKNILNLKSSTSNSTTKIYSNRFDMKEYLNREDIDKNDTKDINLDDL